MSEKKFYTFLNITKGEGDVKYCTAVLNLSHPQMKETSTGKKVLTCSAAFTNREKALTSALGADVNAQGDTVWCDVQFWDTLAERFQKFLGERDKARLVICGRLSLRQWKKEDGTEMSRVQIAANDWFNLPTTAAASVETPSAESAPVEEELPLW